MEISDCNLFYSSFSTFRDQMGCCNM
jgi:hypothetical protein